MKSYFWPLLLGICVNISSYSDFHFSPTYPHIPPLTPFITEQMNGHRWPSLGDSDSTGHFRTQVFLAVKTVTVKCVNHMKADIRENTTPCLIWPSGLRLPTLTIMRDYGLEWNQWHWSSSDTSIHSFITGGSQRASRWDPPVTQQISFTLVNGPHL